MSKYHCKTVRRGTPIHTTVAILTFVDPITQEPYGHVGVRVGKSFKSPDRNAKKLDRVSSYNARRMRKNPARQFVMGPK